MNAEIYFPRNGKAFGQTSEKSFETAIKKLTSVNVNIIYKTEINLTEESISEALKVSDSGEEKIGMIFVADALTEDDPEKAREFFEGIGILSKVKRLESEWHDPMVENDPSDPDAGGKKRKKRKKNYNDIIEDEYEDGYEDEYEDEDENKDKDTDKDTDKDKDDDMIDISGGYVSIERKPFYAYCAEYSSKLIVLLPEHESLDTDFVSVLYTAARKAVVPKKKRSFWKRIIPCKGDGPLDVVRKIILILAIATFIVSSYMLINILVIEPAVNDKTTSSIRSLLVSTDENQNSDTKKSTDGSEGVLSDFSKLLEANPDTVGWITVPNTVIDYVVVQSPEDAQNAAEDKDPHYLFKDFYNNYSKYGTIFLDYRSPLDAKNLLLHGHHMQDGRMFSNIMYYANDLDFYKKTPVFTFNTLYEKSKWKVIAVIKTNTLSWQGPVFNYLRGNFSSDYDFLNFVYELRMRSIINCPVDVNENDTLVTLSTCAYDFDDFRCIVVARKVRDGEGTEVDVSKAELNPNPLYPDIWYNTYGGVKPVVTSFQDAFNKGEITWYDGEGKWSAKDDEDLAKLLNEGKINAEKMLKESYDRNSYEKEQLKEIDSIIKKYMERINEAAKASEINDLYAQAVAEIQLVKTKSQISAEAEASKRELEESKKLASEQALSEAKENAVYELRASVADKTYNIAEYNKVQDILDKYTTSINKAKNVQEIDKLKENGLKELARIKTAEETSEESGEQESSKEESSRE